MLWLMAYVGYLCIKELRFTRNGLVTLHCDNVAMVHIASDLAYHGCSKDIEIDCHYSLESGRKEI